MVQLVALYGITSSSGNYKTIKKKIQEFNIDISHFTRKLKKVKVSERVNNNEDNLELLCPNCHALTENYGNLNKNSKRIR